MTMTDLDRRGRRLCLASLLLAGALGLAGCQSQSHAGEKLYGPGSADPSNYRGTKGTGTTDYNKTGNAKDGPGKFKSYSQSLTPGCYAEEPKGSAADEAFDVLLGRQATRLPAPDGSLLLGWGGGGC